MASGTGTILEVRLETNGLSSVIACPAVLRPAPGQYLAASSPESSEAFPTILFPSRIGSQEIGIAAPIPAHWKVGMQVDLRGPLGKGFHMPLTARRIALSCPEGAPDRLLPLAYLALAQNAAVAIYASAVPAGLPPEVEILPLDLLPEAPGWADYMAVDVSLPSLPLLRSWLGLAPYQRLGCPTQVLLSTPMPCCGLAECGVCAVPTRGKWALACSDGPVFDFSQLEDGR